MKAFIDTQVSKIELLQVLEAHAEADNFSKGIYWEEGKGCAVGCSLESFTDDNSNHGEYERLFGIPRILAKLEDSIFEGLSNKDSKWWPLAFVNAIPEGADLEMVWPEFAVWLLTDKKDGVIKSAKTSEQKSAIEKVASLYVRKIKGGDVSVKEWKEAAYAADAAYAYAAYAADACAAAYAAACAAANACAAAYAACAAANACAANANSARKRQADKLIELIKKAHVE